MYAITEENGRRITMPLANAVWLRGNPSFEGIPRGHVIHHLDYDPMNDDVSNLALMYKLHHIAHHFKNKTCIVPIKYNIALMDYENNFDYPTKKPRIYQRPKADNWFLAYYMCGGKRKLLYKMNGRNFISKKEAEEAINMLWPDNKWDDVKCPSSATAF